jgi:predicted dehydrogenase
MNHRSPRTALSRRAFLRTSAAGGALLGVPAFARTLGESRLRVLSIGVTGTVGGLDRTTVAKHPLADITGLCDIDAKALARAGAEHPEAFRCADYREAFDKHGEKFDAVIVATPDHSHCPIMTLALSRGKHVYGQKPLVQQLEEVSLLERAAAARPDLVTQTGAQRIASPGRRAAVALLKKGALGRVREVHATFGKRGALSGGTYFHKGPLRDPVAPPGHVDFDLWLAGNAKAPYRPGLLPRTWRSWFDYGAGMIGDWIVHVTDVLFYAFPDLGSPASVRTETRSTDLTHFHAHGVRSTVTWKVEGDAFAGKTLPVHLYDTGQGPDLRAFGIPPGRNLGNDIWLIVVSEGGVLLLTPDGKLELLRDGKTTDGMKEPGLPALPKFNHWHAWVDKALGRETPHRWAPFEACLKPTELGLLAVKAAKFPGETLEWDRKALAFTNHAEATRTIVKRDYREGFAPVRL